MKIGDKRAPPRTAMANLGVSLRSARAVSMTVGIALVSWGSLAAVRSQSQPALASSRFEVVSVKPHASNSDSSKISSDTPGRFTATNTPQWFLILYAFEIPEYQLIGALNWTYDATFAVVGTYPQGRRPTDHDTRVMLQNLLVDRFSLKLRHEQRELPTYALVRARNDGRPGPQLQRSDADCLKWAQRSAQRRMPGVQVRSHRRASDLLA